MKSTSTKTKTNHGCSCGQVLELVDASEHSQTRACPACRRCTLMVRHPRFELCVSLADFHLKRGDNQEQRPLDDLDMAMRLFECLVRDEWPSPAITVDYGIASPEHFGALQHAVREAFVPTSWIVSWVTGRLSRSWYGVSLVSLIAASRFVRRTTTTRTSSTADSQ